MKQADKKVYTRFYEELNDFLPPSERKKETVRPFNGRQSVKDIIESAGVPHPEVDLILVNGNSVDFGYMVQDEDRISIYPEFESFDISGLQKLRPEPLREPKFVLDVHLGRLAIYMRMAGFDTYYRTGLEDEEIAKISFDQKRSVLTRDIGLLKRTKVTRGYFVRNTDPVKQLKEVVTRFDLKKHIEEFTRCTRCNSLLQPVPKEEVLNELPPKVKEKLNEFHRCTGCGKIYWPGTHYDNMKAILDKIR